MAHALLHVPLNAFRAFCQHQVVDETDRLLRQSYQEWLPRVLSDISQSHYQSDMLACAEDASIWSGQMPYSRQRCGILSISIGSSKCQQGTCMQACRTAQGVCPNSSGMTPVLCLLTCLP